MSRVVQGVREEVTRLHSHPFLNQGMGLFSATTRYCIVAQGEKKMPELACASNENDYRRAKVLAYGYPGHGRMKRGVRRDRMKGLP